MNTVEEQAIEEQVVLVDRNDRTLGSMGKTRAHLEGQLHRAFSVFVFNDSGELLLQKRADEKYHSGGLWTNTTCSHPRPGEAVIDAAVRRLDEEMGFSCDLKFIFSFLYRSELDHGMIEHEVDHVFVGHSDSIPNPDSAEVSDWKYVHLDEIRSQLSKSPEFFTTWFRYCFERVVDNISNKSHNEPA